MRRLFVLSVCLCALASASAKATVLAAEPGTVSVGDAVPIPVSGNDIMLLSFYDSYYGSISGTYLEYMRGYLSKLPPGAHYVGARVGQYDYIFAYGEGLSYDSGSFMGDATVVRWNTYNNGSMSVSHDGAFRLDAGVYLVYTDLSDRYPGLATSSDMTLRQILILSTVSCLCLTMVHMYQVRRTRRLGREGNREGDA